VKEFGLVFLFPENRNPSHSRLDLLDLIAKFCNKGRPLKPSFAAVSNSLLQPLDPGRGKRGRPGLAYGARAPALAEAKGVR
jgi:hypothetical protein